MRKFWLVLICFVFFFVQGVVNAESELPSQVGIVENVMYEDMPSIHQGIENVKQIALIRVKSGDFRGELITADNVITGNPAYDIPLKKGDKVILHLEKKVPEIESIQDVNFYVADIKRDFALIFLGSGFILILIFIGRKKGLNSLISILATILLIFFGLIPMILNGFNPIVATLAITLISTIIAIYLVGGLNRKSTAAIIGTCLSLIIAGILASVTIFLAGLTGFSSEESMFLYTVHPEINFCGILVSAMLIAALGALMDTAISIASTINEIHKTNPELTVKQLFTSGMNVGKDIIGTMSNTLILVYVGNSLPLALLSSNIDLQKFFNLNQVATEISSALVGSIAILTCVPLTAFIASFMLKKNSEDIIFSIEEKEL